MAHVMQSRGAVGEAEDFLTLLFVQLGYARTGLQDAPGAGTAFQTALAWRPKDVSANLGLAWSLIQQARPADAESPLRTVIAVEPESVDAHRLMAQALEAMGRHWEAQEHWRLTQQPPVTGR
ncbi:MAG: tetratricopeptide repeat protein [Armatimonadetes bacterium]|nr:tetratricopeptide repeat protein [Armatimonadota bacterium]